MTADPFDTERLRRSVLDAWTSSPTRFREDANAEEDLYLGGYRDRLLVELAQNAADAAGSGGVLSLSVVDGELRAANTGAPLDTAGVAALASLRATAKRTGHGVGRFGVGFAAVLAVSDAPRVVSRTGSVRFSAEDTRTALARHPELVTERGGQVPVLRLVWPIDEAPPTGFDTEIRLPLRDDVDAEALLAGFAEQVEDLLLALPALRVIRIGDAEWSRVDGPLVELRGPAGIVRWLVRRAEGQLSAEVGDSLGVEARERPQWTVCWAVPTDEDGTPRPRAEDVLHGPTPTDERLSLPARLIATLPIEPTRRRLLPGPAVDAVLAAAAEVYVELVMAVEPAQRTVLVPSAGFPLSEVDDQLRALLLTELRRHPWLPAASGPELAPARARVLDLPVAGLLTDVLPGLVADSLSEPRHAGALAVLEVPRLRAAELVEAITGVSRPPTWWHALYAGLAKAIDADPSSREELGAIPVPLADGRTLPGARGALLLDGDAGLLDTLAQVDVAGLRVVHPDAAHPLLERLGARRGGPVDLLDAGPLQDAVERSLDDVESGMDIDGVVDVVLRLVADAGIRAGERPWLGAIALPDDAGDHRRADELALPTSPLLDVVDEDSPLGVLAEKVAQAWPAEVLTAVGVLDGFAVVLDEQPVGPDHDLDDEDRWWDSHPEPPARVLAIRDLDLVAEGAWPKALRMLAGEPETWRALHVVGGYAPWWLARHALLDGAAPLDWRLPEANTLAGLYDPIPDLGLEPTLLAAIGVRTALVVDTVADVEDLLARLGDPARSIPQGAVLRAHAALATAVLDGLTPSDVHLPDFVRTLSGATGVDCLVLDQPWLLAVLPASELVSAGPELSLAEPLAELLDLALAGDEVDGEVVSVGERVSWSELGAVALACELLDLPVPEGGPVMHDELSVRVDGETHVVTWWVADGVAHCADTPDALARALAWTTDRWPDRHTLTAVIESPDFLLT